MNQPRAVTRPSLRTGCSSVRGDQENDPDQIHINRTPLPGCACCPSLSSQCNDLPGSGRDRPFGWSGRPALISDARRAGSSRGPPRTWPTLALALVAASQAVAWSRRGTLRARRRASCCRGSRDCCCPAEQAERLNRNKKPRRSGAFPSAPEKTRTSTDHTVHKVLNLAQRASTRGRASRSSKSWEFVDGLGALDGVDVHECCRRR